MTDQTPFLLLDKIEQAIDAYYDVVASAVGTWDDHVAAKQALVAVIVQEQTVLRERAERLRQWVVDTLEASQGIDDPPFMYQRCDGPASDLVDDLVTASTPNGVQ